MLYLNIVIAGISTGAVYGLVALGYNLIYNATGVFNLAQGDMISIAVMLLYVLYAGLKLPLFLDYILILLALAIVGAVEERIVVRPLVRRNSRLGWLVSTLGFSIVIESVIVILYGQRPTESLPSPITASGWHVAGLSLAPRQLAVPIAMFVCAIAIAVMSQRSRFGRSMRAVAEDWRAAALRGINPNSVARRAFVLGAAVAGIAGIVIGPLTGTLTGVGLTYSLDGFVAMAIGGFGYYLRGCWAALLIGVCQSFFDYFVSAQYDVVVGLILLLIALVAIPGRINSTAAVREI